MDRLVWDSIIPNKPASHEFNFSDLINRVWRMDASGKYNFQLFTHANNCNVVSDTIKSGRHSYEFYGSNSKTIEVPDKPLDNASMTNILKKIAVAQDGAIRVYLINAEHRIHGIAVINLNVLLRTGMSALSEQKTLDISGLTSLELGVATLPLRGAEKEVKAPGRKSKRTETVYKSATIDSLVMSGFEEERWEQKKSEARDIWSKTDAELYDLVPSENKSPFIIARMFENRDSERHIEVELRTAEMHYLGNPITMEPSMLYPLGGDNDDKDNKSNKKLLLNKSTSLQFLPWARPLMVFVITSVNEVDTTQELRVAREARRVLNFPKPESVLELETKLREFEISSASTRNRSGDDRPSVDFKNSNVLLELYARTDPSIRVYKKLKGHESLPFLLENYMARIPVSVEGEASILYNPCLVVHTEEKEVSILPLKVLGEWDSHSSESGIWVSRLQNGTTFVVSRAFSDDLDSTVGAEGFKFASMEFTDSKTRQKIMARVRLSPDAKNTLLTSVTVHGFVDLESVPLAKEAVISKLKEIVKEESGSVNPSKRPKRNRSRLIDDDDDDNKEKAKENEVEPTEMDTSDDKQQRDVLIVELTLSFDPRSGFVAHEMEIVSDELVIRTEEEEPVIEDDDNEEVPANSSEGDENKGVDDDGDSDMSSGSRSKRKDPGSDNDGENLSLDDLNAALSTVAQQRSVTQIPLQSIISADAKTAQSNFMIPWPDVAKYLKKQTSFSGISSSSRLMDKQKVQTWKRASVFDFKEIAKLDGKWFAGNIFVVTPSTETNEEEIKALPESNHWALYVSPGDKESAYLPFGEDLSQGVVSDKPYVQVIVTKTSHQGFVIFDVLIDKDEAIPDSTDVFWALAAEQVLNSVVSEDNEDLNLYCQVKIERQILAGTNHIASLTVEVEGRFHDEVTAEDVTKDAWGDSKYYELFSAMVPSTQEMMTLIAQIAKSPDQDSSVKLYGQKSHSSDLSLIDTASVKQITNGCVIVVEHEEDKNDDFEEFQQLWLATCLVPFSTDGKGTKNISGPILHKVWERQPSSDDDSNVELVPRGFFVSATDIMRAAMTSTVSQHVLDSDRRVFWTWTHNYNVSTSDQMVKLGCALAPFVVGDAKVVRVNQPELLIPFNAKTPAPFVTIEFGSDGNTNEDTGITQFLDLPKINSTFQLQQYTPPPPGANKSRRQKVKTGVVEYLPTPIPSDTKQVTPYRVVNQPGTDGIAFTGYVSLPPGDTGKETKGLASIKQVIVDVGDDNTLKAKLFRVEVDKVTTGTKFQLAARRSILLKDNDKWDLINWQSSLFELEQYVATLARSDRLSFLGNFYSHSGQEGDGLETTAVDYELKYVVSSNGTALNNYVTYHQESGLIVDHDEDKEAVYFVFIYPPQTYSFFIKRNFKNIKETRSKRVSAFSLHELQNAHLSTRCNFKPDDKSLVCVTNPTAMDIAQPRISSTVFDRVSRVNEIRVFTDSLNDELEEDDAAMALDPPVPQPFKFQYNVPNEDDSLAPTLLSLDVAVSLVEDQLKISRSTAEIYCCRSFIDNPTSKSSIRLTDATHLNVVPEGAESRMPDMVYTRLSATENFGKFVLVHDINPSQVNVVQRNGFVMLLFNGLFKDRKTVKIGFMDLDRAASGDAATAVVTKNGKGKKTSKKGTAKAPEATSVTEKKTDLSKSPFLIHYLPIDKIGHWSSSEKQWFLSYQEFANKLLTKKKKKEPVEAKVKAAVATPRKARGQTVAYKEGRVWLGHVWLRDSQTGISVELNTNPAQTPALAKPNIQLISLSTKETSVSVRCDLNVARTTKKSTFLKELTELPNPPELWIVAEINVQPTDKTKSKFQVTVMKQAFPTATKTKAKTKDKEKLPDSAKTKAKPVPSYFAATFSKKDIDAARQFDPLAIVIASEAAVGISLGGAEEPKLFTEGEMEDVGKMDDFLNTLEAVQKTLGKQLTLFYSRESNEVTSTQSFWSTALTKTYLPENKRGGKEGSPAAASSSSSAGVSSSSATTVLKGGNKAVKEKKTRAPKTFEEKKKIAAAALEEIQSKIKAQEDLELQGDELDALKEQEEKLTKRLATIQKNIDKPPKDTGADYFRKNSEWYEFKTKPPSDVKSETRQLQQDEVLIYCRGQSDADTYLEIFNLATSDELEIYNLESFIATRYGLKWRASGGATGSKACEEVVILTRSKAAPKSNHFFYACIWNKIGFQTSVKASTKKNWTFAKTTNAKSNTTITNGKAVNYMVDKFKNEDNEIGKIVFNWAIFARKQDDAAAPLQIKVLDDYKTHRLSDEDKQLPIETSPPVIVKFTVAVKRTKLPATKQANGKGKKRKAKDDDDEENVVTETDLDLSDESGNETEIKSDGKGKDKGKGEDENEDEVQQPPKKQPRIVQPTVKKKVPDGEVAPKVNPLKRGADENKDSEKAPKKAKVNDYGVSLELKKRTVLGKETDEKKNMTFYQSAAGYETDRTNFEMKTIPEKVVSRMVWMTIDGKPIAIGFVLVYAMAAPNGQVIRSHIFIHAQYLQYMTGIAWQLLIQSAAQFVALTETAWGPGREFWQILFSNDSTHASFVTYDSVLKINGASMVTEDGGIPRALDLEIPAIAASESTEKKE